MESSVKSRTGAGWFCVWTPTEKWKQHFLGLEVQAAEFVNNGYDLLELSRSNPHVCGNLQAWRSQSSMLDLALAF